MAFLKVQTVTTKKYDDGEVRESVYESVLNTDHIVWFREFGPRNALKVHLLSGTELFVRADWAEFCEAVAAG